MTTQLHSPKTLPHPPPSLPSPHLASSPQITTPATTLLTPGNHHGIPIRTCVHTPASVKLTANTAPANLNLNPSTSKHSITPARHIIAPMKCVCRTGSRMGMKGRYFLVPGALAMARRCREGVRREVRRAWPPRRSWAVRV